MKENELIFYKFLLSGKTGMKKAVWNKFVKRTDFGAAFREVHRDLNGFEVALIEIETTPDNPLKTLKKYIGEILLNKYEIQID